MRSPIGGIPGIVPGQMAFGQSSALAGAPSMTGGILSIDSSSLGNLKPASLKAFPKSFSLGKSIWHVLQLVPYRREKAGMARLWCDVRSKRARTASSRNLPPVRNERPRIPNLLAGGEARRAGIPLPPTVIWLNGTEVFRFVNYLAVMPITRLGDTGISRHAAAILRRRLFS